MKENMNNSSSKPQTIEEYISTFPKDIQNILQKIKKAIKSSAPGAEEVISYQIPAFKLNGILVYFAAFKNHIGFFPTSSGVNAFKKDITAYKYSKGTIQFPIQKPIPYGLIKRIVKYRVKENVEKANKIIKNADKAPSRSR
jgi:uncharacterized protein YdhG (YjbR/CyaY superfamily)